MIKKGVTEHVQGLEPNGFGLLEESSVRVWHVEVFVLLDLKLQVGLNCLTI